VTAGNSSSLNDGAAAVILGIGPVLAIRKVIEQGGRSLRRLDQVELSEAFGAPPVSDRGIWAGVSR
jgi:acetyl-CoA acetyltransferase